METELMSTYTNGQTFADENYSNIIGFIPPVVAGAVLIKQGSDTKKARRNAVAAQQLQERNLQNARTEAKKKEAEEKLAQAKKDEEKAIADEAKINEELKKRAEQSKVSDSPDAPTDTNTPTPEKPKWIMPAIIGGSVLALIVIVVLIKK
jgi:hypothetical protein